jgi:2-polyprenyl-6-methoxyphenol hydroxylase-like FAD-dependent oxidoreductase
MSLPILIIGGGIGGLSLAQGLKHAGIPFYIFDRDLASNFRAQGYRVRINGDGAAALQQMLPPELFVRFEASSALPRIGFNLNAIDGQVLPSMFPPQHDRMQYPIDRTVFRSLLMHGLEAEMEFGKEFRRYEIGDDGVTAHFSDGSAKKGRFLVGADGLRSNVRKQFLPDHKMVDTEGRAIYGKTVLTDELTTRFSEHAQRGMSIAQDTTREVSLTLIQESIRFQENEIRSSLPKDYVYWVLSSRKDYLGLPDEELFELSGEETVALSLKLTAAWDPSLRCLFELQDPTQTALLRISSAKPDLPSWEPSARITLLGDAVHAMSPTGGVGANEALQDSADLLKVLKGDISAETVGAYEAVMREHAGKAILGSGMGGKKFFNMRPFSELPELEL